MSTNVPSSSSSDPLPVPREALVMKQILESMGVEKYEPRVVSQLMEFAQRYVTSVVEDADDYKAHARKAIMDAGDARLAIRTNSHATFKPSLHRRNMEKIAAQRNKLPLPKLPTREGLWIPDQNLCVAAEENYQVQAPK